MSEITPDGVHFSLCWARAAGRSWETVLVLHVGNRKCITTGSAVELDIELTYDVSALTSVSTA